MCIIIIDIVLAIGCFAVSVLLIRDDYKILDEFDKFIASINQKRK